MTGLVTPRGRQHLAQQFNLWPLITSEDGLSDSGRAHAGPHQFGGDLKSAFGRVRVMKRSGVGEESRVNAFGDFFRDADAHRLAQVVNHFANCGSSRIDPVYGAEERGGRMVIDIDDELFFQIDQAGPVDV